MDIINQDILKKAVQQSFLQFKLIWDYYKSDDPYPSGQPSSNWKSFWTRGNTFDAYLRFVNAAEKSGFSNMAMTDLRMELIKTNDDFFSTQLKKGPGFWADDFGWVGMASLQALSCFSDPKDPLAVNYLNHAESCWRLMIDRGYDSEDSATPVPHGCRNSTQQNEPDHPKNSVTNLNLLLLSLRLYGVNKESKYLDMIIFQYLWFQSWFKIQSTDGDNGPYLYILSEDQGGLLHERPMHETNYTVTGNPAWNTGWLWTGDQGALLAALAEILQIQDDLKNRYPDLENQYPDIKKQYPDLENQFKDLEKDTMNVFQSVATGIIKLLCDEYSVLQEAPIDNSYGSDFAGAYVCGRGVLLRHLSQKSVMDTMSDLPQNSVKDIPDYTSAFTRIIDETANAAWNSHNTNGSFNFSAQWGSDDEVKNFNKKFFSAWKYGFDGFKKWNFSQINEPFDGLFGVLQANGLDALTAKMCWG